MPNLWSAIAVLVMMAALLFSIVARSADLNIGPDMPPQDMVRICNLAAMAADISGVCLAVVRFPQSQTAQRKCQQHFLMAEQFKGIMQKLHTNIAPDQQRTLLRNSGLTAPEMRYCSESIVAFEENSRFIAQHYIAPEDL